MFVLHQYVFTLYQCICLHCISGSVCIAPVYLFTLHWCVCLHCISSIHLHFISASVYIVSVYLFILHHCFFTFYQCIRLHCINVSIYIVSVWLHSSICITMFSLHQHVCLHCTVVVAHLSTMMEQGLCSLVCTLVSDDGTGTVFFGLHTCQ